MMMMTSNSDHDEESPIVDGFLSSPDKQQHKPSKVVMLVALLLAVVVIVAVVLGTTLGMNSNKQNSNDSPASSSVMSSSLSSDSTIAPSLGPTVGLMITETPTSAISDGTATTTPSSISTVVSPTGPPPTNTAVPSMKPSMQPSTLGPSIDVPVSAPGETILGVTSNGIAYLACRNDTTSDGTNTTISDNFTDNTKQIVLLHGATFTKETWQSDDMLQKFCQGAKVVVALDLGVFTSYLGLIEVLETLRENSTNSATGEQQAPLISSTDPTVTLVTPSASGYAVVSWITDGNITQLPDYVSEWVPVAPGSLVSASDDQVAALKELPSTLFRILAINGNEDSAGGKYSARLAELANATAVELIGRHAVYLQSPDEFVQTILEF